MCPLGMSAEVIISVLKMEQAVRGRWGGAVCELSVSALLHLAHNIKRSNNTRSTNVF